MVHGEFTSDLFIKRTKDVLEQYNKMSESISRTEIFGERNKEFFDVTLSVNCLYGLIMVMSQKQYDALLAIKKEAVEYLYENNISEDEIKITAKMNCSKCDESCEDKDIKIKFHELFRSLRNGLAHWEYGDKSHENIRYISDGNGNVEALEITGQIDRYRKTVTVTFFLKNNKGINPIFALIQLIPLSKEPNKP